MDFSDELSLFLKTNNKMVTIELIEGICAIYSKDYIDLEHVVYKLFEHLEDWKMSDDVPPFICSKGWIELLRYIKTFYTLNVPCMMSAIENNHWHIVRYLINYGVNPDVFCAITCVETHNYAMLHYLVENHNCPLSSLVLDHAIISDTRCNQIISYLTSKGLKQNEFISSVINNQNIKTLRLNINSPIWHIPLIKD